MDVRGIYADYVGWIDGNPTNLYPLPPAHRGQKMLDVIGGSDKALLRANEAIKAKEFRWAAELSDYLLAVDPGNSSAKQVKARALTELGERQVNATARNYYLTTAQFLMKDPPAK